MTTSLTPEQQLLAFVSLPHPNPHACALARIPHANPNSSLLERAVSIGFTEDDAWGIMAGWDGRDWVFPEGQRGYEIGKRMRNVVGR